MSSYTPERDTMRKVLFSASEVTDVRHRPPACGQCQKRDGTRAKPERWGTEIARRRDDVPPPVPELIQLVVSQQTTGSTQLHQIPVQTLLLQRDDPNQPDLRE